VIYPEGDTPILDRRTFLAATTGVLAAGQVNAQSGASSFVYGVASGDPSATSVVIWTALASLRNAEELRWRLWSEDDRSIVHEGVVTASAETGWTAKVAVDGLRPDASYLYAFSLRGTSSPTGRTRTLPARGHRPVRFAVFSCARYTSGWFHAYRHAAEDRSIDFALHLGDYIYESGNAAAQVRDHRPAYELMALNDYRARHAQHKTDPDLAALHAAMPMMAIWDDHEFADEASSDGSGTSRPALWPQRSAAARQAYFEWMPMLPNDTGGLWRSKRVGDLIDLYLLDTRFEGRSAPRNPEDQDFKSPTRQLLGDTQERWVARSLATTHAPWTIVLSSVILSRLVWPEALRDRIGVSGPSWGRPLLEQRIARSALGAGNPDAWDGYPAAQARFLKLLGGNRGRSLILSGDTHSSWLFRVNDSYGRRIGWEVGVPSVTTEASLDTLAGPPEMVEALFQSGNPTLDYLHPSARGYVVVEVADNAAHVEWRHVSSVRTARPTWRIGKRLRFAAA
jgi:alkaline phosphatase D